MDRILYGKAAQLSLLQESSSFREDKPYFHPALLYAEHLVVCWKKLLPSVA